MEHLFKTVLALKERGLLPDAVMRILVRQMCGAWVKTFECGGDTDKQAHYKKKYFEKLRASAGATHQGDANVQHYEVPTEFFHLMLGPHLKYSCCLFPQSSTSLAEAEVAMLHTFLEERLRLSKLVRRTTTLRVLDLGCGWGSHGSYVLDNYDNVDVTFLSNSATQQEYIASKNQKHAGRFTCVKADASSFDDPGFRDAFDVIVSCEMLEHMKNYDMVLKKVSSWLKSDGRMMVQILGNRRFAYDFKTTDWMGKYFFAGGTMPSRDLFEHFLPPDLKQAKVWDVNGREYTKTLDAWLHRLDTNKAQCLQALEGGPTSASIALERWRMFLLFCSEVFAYRGGNEWMVFHYLFEKVKV
ncbi:class I SAM-dependent methyltransferase [Mycolicibacterium sp.]|uniref:SAM-dependent methyltransferase n=1 Tax=Mycolicibacterium sp. TaxID=2320850 RepID=UPI0028AF833F|nr:class I SAM-dependent methyltransferase [Mycolicibacterium sp.]